MARRSKAATKAAQERAQRILAERHRREARRKGLIAAGAAAALVLVVVVVMVVVKLSSGGPKAAPAPVDSAAATAVINAVTHVPATALNQVGAGKVDQLPKPITGPNALTADGKPLVFYVGAEYCPFCAAQRWPVVVALSRFGTFGNLGLTRSAADDTFPNTPTLTFHGASYTSQYVSFQGVETAKNTRGKDGNYEALDKLTPGQQQILAAVDKPPYVSADSVGSIPFLDLGNRYVIAGASYSPNILAGKSYQQIADALKDPASPIAQAVDGTANALTAAICKLTNGQPGDVCSSAGVTAYTAKV